MMARTSSLLFSCSSSRACILVMTLLPLVAGCASAPQWEFSKISPPKSESFSDRLESLWGDFGISRADQAELMAIGSKQDPRGVTGITDIKRLALQPYEKIDYMFILAKFQTDKRGVCLGMALGAVLNARFKAGEKIYGIQLNCSTSFANVKYNLPVYEATYGVEGLIEVEVRDYDNFQKSLPHNRTLLTDWN